MVVRRTFKHLHGTWTVCIFGDDDDEIEADYRGGSGALLWLWWRRDDYDGVHD